jgi:hypothetical protein
MTDPRRKRSIASLLAISLLTWSCSPALRVTITGKKHAPRPTNCEVRFLEMDPDRAVIEYEQIGMISADGVDPVSPDKGLWDDIRVRACQMGGTVVVPLGDEHSWGEDSASFLVLTATPPGAR